MKTLRTPLLLALALFSLAACESTPPAQGTINSTDNGNRTADDECPRVDGQPCK